MKIIKQAFHQGDVQAYVIDGVPTDAKLIEKQFIAASERSGSFHAMFGPYKQYEVKDGFVIECEDECILNHSLKEHLTGKSFDKKEEIVKKDHRHTIVPKGVYFVGIQQRFDPLSGLKQKVRD